LSSLGPEVRRIGIMGGTFDPIHYGHLVCAEQARDRFALTEVLFVPTGTPWQKPVVASAEDRYLLAMLATASNQSFSVSRMEIDRGGLTYTVETLDLLRDFYGDGAELYFIAGADAVAEVVNWKDPERVVDLAAFIAASRPGYDLAQLQGGLFGKRVRVMEIPDLKISSTFIRRRVAEGRSVRYLVPDRVARYIESRGLYRDGDP
jgi:nicotinate-nucleotide adenylyltransferase